MITVVSWAHQGKVPNTLLVDKNDSDLGEMVMGTSFGDRLLG